MTIKLPKEVTDAGIRLAKQPAYARAVYPKYGAKPVDFENLTVAEAKRLVSKKFPLLTTEKAPASQTDAAKKK